MKEEFADTIDIEVVKNAMEDAGVSKRSNDYLHEQVEEQKTSINRIKEALQAIEKKRVVYYYFTLLGIGGLVLFGLTLFTGIQSGNNSSMLVVAVVSGVLLLSLLSFTCIEAYRFFKIRRDASVIRKNILLDNALNPEEKSEGIRLFEKMREQVNAVTALSYLLGDDVKSGAIDFKELHCISFADKERIIALRGHITSLQEQVVSLDDQVKRYDVEVNEIIETQNKYVIELTEIVNEYKTIPSLKNDFNITLEKYQNIGGERAELILENEWRGKVGEIELQLTSARQELQGNEENLSKHKKDSETTLSEFDHSKKELEKELKRLEKSLGEETKKQNNAIKLAAQSNEEIKKTNSEIEELKAQVAAIENPAEHAAVDTRVQRQEEKLQRLLRDQHKAEGMISHSSIISEIETKIVKTQNDLVVQNRISNERQMEFEQQIHQLANVVSKNKMNVHQVEDQFNERVSQREEALKPYQSLIAVMLQIDKKIRATNERYVNERPGLEAKIAGTDQRLQNMKTEKVNVEMQLHAQKQSLNQSEFEIETLSNNFVE